MVSGVRLRHPARRAWASDVERLCLDQVRDLLLEEFWEHAWQRVFAAEEEQMAARATALRHAERKAEDLDRQIDTLLGHLAHTSIADLTERKIARLCDERMAVGRELDTLRRDLAAARLELRYGT